MLHTGPEVAVAVQQQQRPAAGDPRAVIVRRAEADVRRALDQVNGREPLGHEPLDKLVGPGAKVTIAFDDPAGPAYPHPDGWQDARQTVVGVLLIARPDPLAPTSRFA